MSSTGAVDSAAPPVPTAGTPAAPVDVAPGGNLGAAEQIAAFAYLITHGDDAAVVAAAVLTRTDPGGVPSCADRAAASALLTAAGRRAGPYTVSVKTGTERARPGRPIEVTATVRTSRGEPVPGARVSFEASDARFADGTRVTDAGGVARTSLTPASGPAASLTITATTSVATGLREATITARRSATNPSGASVPAVYATPATPFSGTTSLHVDRAAHPVVSTALESRLARVGRPFTPRAQVSGLNGHSADVSFDLLGPLPLKNRTLCGAIAARAWSDDRVHLAGTSSVAISADGTARGGAVTPRATGCYALRTEVATRDASPAVTKRAPLTVLAVLDTAVSTSDDEPAVFSAATGSRGDLAGVLDVTDTYGLPGRLTVSVTGPITPRDGDCGVDAPTWQRAATRTIAATVRGPASPSTVVGRAGRYGYTAAAPGRVGCYRAQPVLTLTGPGGDTLTVGAEDDRPVYLLRPELEASVARTWAVSPASVPVRISVRGLFGLPAHVRTAMYVAAATPTGCSAASFTGASRAGTGPTVDVPAAPGVVTVTVESGPTPRLGCYSVVPELTLDADPRVKVTGALGSPSATLIAGVNPERRVARTVAQRAGGTSTAFVLAMTCLAAILLAVIARVGLLAWRDRDGPPDDRWVDPAAPGPLDLTDGDGLPSGS